MKKQNKTYKKEIRKMNELNELMNILPFLIPLAIAEFALLGYTIYHILFFIKTTLCLYEVVQQAGALLHHLYIFWKFYFLIF